MVLLFCIFHDQVATAAGLNITTEYCHIVWLSYNCYRCHFPEGRNFLRFFAKSPHPTVHYVATTWEPALPAALTLVSRMTCRPVTLVRPNQTLQSPGDPRRGGMSLLGFLTKEARLLASWALHAKNKQSY